MSNKSICIIIQLTGSYGQGTRIDLSINNLTRLESSVFQSIMEQMLPFISLQQVETYINFWQSETIHHFLPGVFILIFC